MPSFKQPATIYTYANIIIIVNNLDFDPSNFPFSPTQFLWPYDNSHTKVWPVMTFMTLHKFHFTFYRNLNLTKLLTIVTNFSLRESVFRNELCFCFLYVSPIIMIVEFSLFNSTKWIHSSFVHTIAIFRLTPRIYTFVSDTSVFTILSIVIDTVYLYIIYSICLQI